MKFARLLKSDGTAQKIAPKNGSDFKLDELQGYVGGYIEVVQVAGNRLMVLNEEGKMHNLPMNDIATTLFHQTHPGFDYVVGDVVVCDRSMMK